MAESMFADLPPVVTDEVFDLLFAYRDDRHPNKVNLGAGVYCTEEGVSWPLSAVCAAEKQLQEENSPTRHDYLAIAGDQQFLSLARNLTFSFNKNTPEPTLKAQTARIASVQTVSGTGANHIGARFLAENICPRNVWLSDPTWANHHTIWESVGLNRRSYPYYKKEDCTFDFAGMMKTLEEEASPRDIVVLHACAHNPTGLDPTQEQWKEIASLCQRKQLFPFFDSAYQGFASGNPITDAWAIKYFFDLQPKLEMVVAQSFSKNFGLYGQRAGAVHVVLGDQATEEIRENAVSSLCHLLRSEISMAPKHGSTIVRTVLESEELTAQWMVDLSVMSSRIRTMRVALYDELIRLGTPGSWKHIIDQVCPSICSKPPFPRIGTEELTHHVDWNVFLHRTFTVRG